ncbi:putative glycoprotein or S-layer protein [Clostridium cylindrosporum DSM 605]|uniref:Putative glycoprotein or S-layer protein n=1 Tax=Clostridium cylindrosporum DSM 605 TaxID=1121307 RepID=A0A0J8DDQ2_CLOCY|nr:putative glycoprotein or S-layer protein [Clostridium cylindrosporum DSM 605]
MFNKLNKGKSIVLFLLLTLLVGCSPSNLSKNKVIEDKLIISTYSVENSGGISLFDVNSKVEKTLVKDRKVAVSGDLSKDESQVAYADALSDSDPWQIYLHSLKDNKVLQVTNDSPSKGGARFVNNNLVCFLTVANEMTKVAKLDVNKKTTNIIDKVNLDREAEAFDVKDNNIIISTLSNSLNIKTWEENGGEFKPIPHVILKANLNGEKLKEVGKINASYIDSISYSSNQNKVIICGTDINGNSGAGIYELSLDTGKVATIVTENSIATIKNSSAKEISRPILASSSKDENIIYFTGVSKESAQVTIAEIETYPSTIYSYNTKTKEIKEIYNPKIPSKVFDLNIK